MGLGTAAYNSSNNILFITLSLLLGCLILSGLMSSLNLLGVRWRLEAGAPWRASRPVTVGLGLRNMKKFLPTYGLWFELRLRMVEVMEVKAETTFTARGIDVRAAMAQRNAVEASGTVTLAERLEPRGELRLEWTLQPTKRGQARVELESVGSLFPFGFLKKNVTTEVYDDVIVWPAPVEYRRFANASARRAAGAERQSRPGSGSDLLALRRYAPGDSHRLVHWKASARTRQLLVRQAAAESTQGFSLWLQTDAETWTRPAQFELLVSFAATLAEDLFRANQLTSVRVDLGEVHPMRRVGDLEWFLDRLALLKPRVAAEDGSFSYSGDRPLRIRNILTFAPDGARGVLAFVDGEKTASA